MLHKEIKKEIAGYYFNVLVNYPITTVEIWSSKDKWKHSTLESYGISYCRPEDIPSLVTGVKLALVSAFKKMELSGEQKEVIWKSFAENFAYMRKDENMFRAEIEFRQVKRIMEIING